CSAVRRGALSRHPHDPDVISVRLGHPRVRKLDPYDDAVSPTWQDTASSSSGRRSGRGRRSSDAAPPSDPRVSNAVVLATAGGATEGVLVTDCDRRPFLPAERTPTTLADSGFLLDQGGVRTHL